MPDVFERNASTATTRRRRKERVSVEQVEGSCNGRVIADRTTEPLLLLLPLMIMTTTYSLSPLETEQPGTDA